MNFDKLVESMIKDAQERGEFDNLPGNGEPLFLQMKQARQSVLEPYAGANPFSHAGQRVVVGQRLMQAASDLFLGCYTATAGTKNQYFVRQLRDTKVKPVVDIIKPANLKGYAGLYGQTLARAHARSGDAAVLAGYMGKGAAFEDAMTNFSLALPRHHGRRAEYQCWGIWPAMGSSIRRVEVMSAMSRSSPPPYSSHCRHREATRPT